MSESDVGNFIRKERKLRGWTLKELASKAGLSIGFLSQVERGISSPSILSLDAVFRALQIPLSLLAGNYNSADSGQSSPDGSARSSRKEVVKSEARASIRISSGTIKYQFLSGDFPKRQFEILIGEIPLNYQYPPQAHEGEEFGYVLKGELLLTIDDETYELRRGEGYHFLATRSHGYEAGTSEGVTLLWVQTMKYFNWRDGCGHVEKGDKIPPRRLDWEHTKCT